MASPAPIGDLEPPLVGYVHPAYPTALAALGAPLELPGSGGWLLERSIPGSSARDAVGCYPLLACRRWGRLGADLDELEGRLVSVTFVPDPFAGELPPDLVHRLDVVRPFKTRYVVDLARLRSAPPSEHHRRRARRARRRVEVEVHHAGLPFLEEWIELYSHLVRRRSISDFRRFSADSFRIQLAVPGLVLFRATLAARAIGLQLWYETERGAYNHLLALHPDGYRAGAAYALHDAALAHFSGRVRWLDLGGGAGTSVSRDDGLARWKTGWANETRASLICGRVLDRETFAALSRTTPTTFFPPYRHGTLDANGDCR